MIKVKLNTREWKKIGTKFDRMASRAEKNGNSAAIRKAAVPMLREAKALVRIRTGTLKKALTTRLRREGNVVKAKIGGKKGMPGNRYLHLVEFGTPHARAQPFLRPAYYNKKEESKAIYKREIWNSIRHYVRKERAKA